MPRIVLALELDQMEYEFVRTQIKSRDPDFFVSESNPDQVAIDKAYLKQDPQDDCFYLFDLISLEGDEEA